MSHWNRIPLVDDNPAMRNGLRREFEGAGWIVCGEAANGQEAIEKAELPVDAGNKWALHGPSSETGFAHRAFNSLHGTRGSFQIE